MEAACAGSVRAITGIAGPTAAAQRNVRHNAAVAMPRPWAAGPTA